MGMTFQTITEEVAKELKLQYYQCAVSGCKVGCGFYSLDAVLLHCLQRHPNAKQVGKWKKCLLKAPNEYTTEKYYEEVLSFNRRVEEKLVETIRQQIRNEQNALSMSVAIQTDPAAEKQPIGRPIQTVKEVANVQKRKAVFQGNTTQQKICKLESHDAGAQVPLLLNGIKQEISKERIDSLNITNGGQGSSLPAVVSPVGLAAQQIENQNNTGRVNQYETAIITTGFAPPIVLKAEPAENGQQQIIIAQPVSPMKNSLQRPVENEPTVPTTGMRDLVTAPPFLLGNVKREVLEHSNGFQKKQNTLNAPILNESVSQEFHPVVGFGQGDQQNTTGSGQQRETAIINAGSYAPRVYVKTEPLATTHHEEVVPTPLPHADNSLDRPVRVKLLITKREALGHSDGGPEHIVATTSSADAPQIGLLSTIKQEILEPVARQNEQEQIRPTVAPVHNVIRIKTENREAERVVTPEAEAGNSQVRMVRPKIEQLDCRRNVSVVSSANRSGIDVKPNLTRAAAPVSSLITDLLSISNGKLFKNL